MSREIAERGGGVSAGKKGDSPPTQGDYPLFRATSRRRELGPLPNQVQKRESAGLADYDGDASFRTFHLEGNVGRGRFGQSLALPNAVGRRAIGQGHAHGPQKEVRKAEPRAARLLNLVGNLPLDLDQAGDIGRGPQRETKAGDGARCGSPDSADL
jgi:hypothetical protein